MIPFSITLALSTAYAARAIVARRAERAVAARLRLGADGIVEGAGAIELAGAGPHAALLIHGFGDTPQTLRYLAEYLNARGWSVRAPLLPGHGRSLRAFAASRASDWLGAARAELAAMRARHGSVAVVGLSMGGALATVLAADGGDVPALALVAPYLSMPGWMRRLALAHRVCTPFAPYLHGRGERSIHDPSERLKSLAYGTSTPRLLFELLQVVRWASAASPRVTAPTLVVQSREDNRIPVAACEGAYARLGAREKRLLWLDGCGHLITVDYGRERVLEAVGAWLAANAAAASERAASAATDRRSASVDAPA